MNMSSVPLTADAVIALSPDDASTKAARGLVSLAKWPLLGASEKAIWGACQGSGSKPYQTQVDVSGAGPVFRCSCPSRKFPCKHGLALLLLKVRESASFTAPEPAWVTEWLASRQERAEKKIEKIAKAAAEPVVVDAAVRAKREAQRLQKMQAGAQELALWLDDRVRKGLANISAQDGAQWAAMAARMVDAQASGLGSRITAAFSVVGQGATWHSRLLERLGSLQLLVDAMLRPERLPPLLWMDVRQAAGWPVEKEEVLLHGERVSDQWHVMAQMQEQREHRLKERRVWLLGHTSQRRVLVLDYAFGNAAFEQGWVVGQVCDATLAFYPSADAVRAILLEIKPHPKKPKKPEISSSTSAAMEWQGLAQRIAANPWGVNRPLYFHSVQLQRDDTTWWLQITDAGEAQRIRTTVSEDDVWRLMAMTGGLPFDVWGEWMDETLRLLTAWQGGMVCWMARNS